MSNEKQLTEQESLELITNMIQKVKTSYHERGTSAILWGTVITITSFTNFLELHYGFKLPFDIWLLVLVALIPQIYISISENREIKVKRYQDTACDLVWTAYGISIACLGFYQMIAPQITNKFLETEGQQLLIHYINNSKPNEHIAPFAPSIYSLYIMIYAMPTFVVGLLYKFKPMIFAAILAYIFFFVSLFTQTKYDMLLGAIVAFTSWLIPGIILRRRYLAQKTNNV